MEKIRIGIVGYGNLGRGVQYAATQNEDMEVVAVFTRRDPAAVKTVLPVKVEKMDAMAAYVGKIDVMILCGGSATDLPKQSAEVVRLFDTVDSFDTHAHIPEYFDRLDAAAKEAGHVGAMSIGWDPGLFSLARIFDAQLAVHQRIADLHVQVAGVIFFAVWAGQAQSERVAVAAFKDVIPKFFIETDLAAVQVVAVIVFEEVIVDAVDAHMAVFDAVGTAADDPADILGIALVARHIVVTEDHVDGIAAPVGDPQRLDDAAHVQDHRLVDAVLDAKRHYISAVCRLPEYA